MKKFAIFIRSKKFRWTANAVFYGLITLLLLGHYLAKEFFTGSINPEYFFNLAILVFVFGLARKWLMYVHPGNLHGKLEGFIQFENDRIQINTKSILLDEIHKIDITNEDFYGRYKRSLTSLDLNSAWSNGVNNTVLIQFKTGERISFKFEMYEADDLQEARQAFIHYHVHDKVSLFQLKNILGVDTHDLDLLEGEIKECRAIEASEKK